MSDSDDFLFLLRHLMFFNNKYHEIHKLVLLVSFVVSCRRPSRSSNLVPRLAVVGVVLPLSSRTAATGKQNTLLIMIMSSRRWSRTTARAMPGTGGVEAIYLNKFMLIMASQSM